MRTLVTGTFWKACLRRPAAASLPAWEAASGFGSFQERPIEREETLHSGDGFLRVRPFEQLGRRHEIVLVAVEGMPALGEEPLRQSPNVVSRLAPGLREPVEMAEDNRGRIVTAWWIDADEAQCTLQHQLDRLVRLAHHVVVALPGEEETQGLEPGLDLREVVARDLPRSQRMTSSPSL